MYDIIPELFNTPEYIFSIATTHEKSTEGRSCLIKKSYICLCLWISWTIFQYKVNLEEQVIEVGSETPPENLLDNAPFETIEWFCLELYECELVNLAEEYMGFTMAL